MQTRVRSAILISGRGSNMQALLDAARDKADFPVSFDLVISDRADAAGLDAARKAGCEAIALQRTDAGRAAWEAELATLLQRAGIELVCLAGFMRLISGDFLAGLGCPVLNIHPSLLPDFPGLNAQAQALQSGARFAGCTVHEVTEIMDAGPIIGQAQVPVQADDSVETLSARILREEHRLYPACVERFISERLRPSPTNQPETPVHAH